MKTFEQTLQHYKRYILVTASSFNQDEFLLDLQQEGYIALHEAYINYDDSKGEFHSYALVMIKGYMKNFLTNNARTIRVPSHQLNKTHKKYNDSVEIPSTISLDSNLNDNTSTLKNFMASPIEEDEIDYSRLHIALNNLKDKQRIIIEKYYGFGDTDKMTLQQIGDELNISKEAVRQHKEKGMLILKEKGLSIN